MSANVFDLLKVFDRTIDKSRKWYMREGVVVNKTKTEVSIKYWRDGVVTYDKSHANLLLTNKE